MIGGVVLDVDGTVVRGGEPIPGAPAAVDRLRAAGLPVVFCSNNPTAGPAAYVDRLGGAGIEVDGETVVTAATATAAYLRANHAGASAYVFGEDSVEDRLRETTELRLLSEPGPASVVVATIDYDFGYDDMRLAIQTVDDDTAFVGTDPDPVIPASEGRVPGSGAVVNALAGVIGREPDAVPGKPSATAARLVRERLGVQGEDLLVVGDRLSTDVALGERLGAETALVGTGVTDIDGDGGGVTPAADGDPEPDHVCASLATVVDRVLDREQT